MIQFSQCDMSRKLSIGPRPEFRESLGRETEDCETEDDHEDDRDPVRNGPIEYSVFHGKFVPVLDGAATPRKHCLKPLQ